MGAACLVALTGLISGEVLVRALSEVVPGVPAAFTFGSAMTLRAGGHIRVTLVLGRVSPAVRRWMETVLAGLGVAFSGFLAIAMVNFTTRSFVSDQVSISSGSPLWVPQAVVTFGICLLMLQFVARFIQAALGLPLEDLNMRAASVAE